MVCSYAEADGKECSRPNRSVQHLRESATRSNKIAGRVHLVTGGYGGCGFELAKILYQHNATVYVAGRSKEKGDKAIAELEKLFPDSKGKAAFLALDLADQSTIKKSADEFMAKESRLDVLTQNAGVMVPPAGSKDALGHDLQMGTNCLGPWLFAQCLLPVLKKTAASAPPGSVRVTWAASMAIALAPTGGVVFEKGTVKAQSDVNVQYSVSKVGNVYLAHEFGRRYGGDGIVSVSWNPGNLKTDLTRHSSTVFKLFLNTFILYPAVYGGYTELYAACSPDISVKDNGAFVIPWGRIGYLRGDMIAAEKPKEEGGTGIAQQFWDWCEQECKQYL